jgi:hypothetical protein
MKTIFALFFLVSCTNLQHATSTNLSDVKHFRNNYEVRDFWNQKVASLKTGEEVGCKLLGDVQGRDNIFDQGPEFAELYMKVNAKKIGADSIIVKSKKPVGNYGSEVHGIAYLCNRDKKNN